MGLLDIFKRDSGGAIPAGATANVISGEQAEQARVRARRRLIGAVVLLGIGVIAFPILFETQPRPIPVDIPIVIPPRDGAPPLVLPAPRPMAAAPASTPAVVAPASAAVAAAAASPAKAATETPAPEPVKTTPSPPHAKPEPAPSKPPPEAPKTAATTSKPPPTPAPKVAVEAAKPAAAEGDKPVAAGRFVVQIGAFAEAAAVREARAKAGKAGLSTFTQVVQTSSGARTRVRIGPFGSREDADKAAAQARAAGVPGVVMAL